MVVARPAPALLYDPAADAFEELRGPGLALGLNEAVQYSAVRRVDVRHGQIMALGTDGIWEARNTHGEMWGKERLQDVIRARGGDSAGAIVDSVFDRLKAFTRGTLPEDDKTLVVVRFAA
ncbi:MAG: PP2C family protein-serine/threonine phosphatase [Desulfobacterales bacterium]|jgi:sigma-B regulation protein RsbU (phosphoserine phosphatase)